MSLLLIVKCLCVDFVSNHKIQERKKSISKDKEIQKDCIRKLLCAIINHTDKKGFYQFKVPLKHLRKIKNIKTSFLYYKISFFFCSILIFKIR